MSESKEKINKRKQELYVELKDLDTQIKQLNAHIENIDEQIADLNSNKQTLNKFSELKPGAELRVPLSSGIYVKAELKDIKKVMVNVGASVTVEKTPEEVVVILDGQITELNSYRETLIAQIKQLIVRIEEIQKEFE
jgi:prefoldin alpha subunit